MVRQVVLLLLLEVRQRLQRLRRLCCELRRRLLPRHRLLLRHEARRCRPRPGEAWMRRHSNRWSTAKGVDVDVSEWLFFKDQGSRSAK